MNLPVKSSHIMILTGEPSGDLHAGKLVKEIRRYNPNIYISGTGGPHLESQGVDLFFNIDKLSAMGITEVLFQFRHIKACFDMFRAKLRLNTPDIIIMVDYPGFNLKAAEFAKTHYDIKILYYIPPKVWAWKKSRLKKIKKWVDHTALILPFEEKLYRKAGISATFVGNPLVDEYPLNFTKPFIRAKKTLSKNKEGITIGLLPGSRKAEINNLLEIMLGAAVRIHQHQGQVNFIISQASRLHEHRIKAIVKKYNQNKRFTISDGPVKDIFLRSDLIIAASGTVTLEAALFCVPCIIIYRMSWLSYRMARILVNLEYAGLANLIVNSEVMPEFLQYDATPEKIAQKGLDMLGHLEFYENQLQLVRQMLGSKGASKRTAGIAVGMLTLKK